MAELKIRILLGLCVVLAAGQETGPGNRGAAGCLVSGQWWDGADQLISLATTKGPALGPEPLTLNENRDWLTEPGGAIGCNASGCLLPPEPDRYNCTVVCPGGSSQSQCTWASVNEAKKQCAAWDNCHAFSCQPNNTATTCVARSLTGPLIRAAEFLSATSYVKNLAPWEVLPGGVIGCPGNQLSKCLVPPQPDPYNCTMLSGQCVWFGLEQAKLHCASWENCNAFSCQPNESADVDRCVARSVTGPMIRTGVYLSATSYVKNNRTVSTEIEASCNGGTAGCGWIWAAGSITDSGTPFDRVQLHKSNGVTINGTLDASCSSIEWGDGSSWKNLNQEVKTVHIIHMTHLDVGYTEPSAEGLIDDFVQKWFPAAMKTAEDLRQLKSERCIGVYS